MPTTRDVQTQQRAEAGWAFDPDQVKVETPTGVDPKSSAAQLAARVREDEQAAAEERDQVLDDLQAQRKERGKARRRTRGLSTAEILAARHLGAG
jgi:hypothetical protein